ncbi:Hypothetical predicted protein [Xyrichtys novacula]|uniref:Secreted protein n=1 Tax=Xyrichtys novacula TaxID=13765 RepID=A0AAV1EY84_XYRNO|nr:Hypothetical predicted protein [Xyrichtys novacula]
MTHDVVWFRVVIKVWSAVVQSLTINQTLTSLPPRVEELWQQGGVGSGIKLEHFCVFPQVRFSVVLITGSQDGNEA